MMLTPLRFPLLSIDLRIFLRVSLSTSSSCSSASKCSMSIPESAASSSSSLERFVAGVLSESSLAPLRADDGRLAIENQDVTVASKKSFVICGLQDLALSACQCRSESSVPVTRTMIDLCIRSRLLVWCIVSHYVARTYNELLTRSRPNCYRRRTGNRVQLEVAASGRSRLERHAPVRLSQQPLENMESSWKKGRKD